MAEQFTPEIVTELGEDIVRVPEIVLEASGIKIFEKLIRSAVSTMDTTIIRNIGANVVAAVYPFTLHSMITENITEVADIPVFSDIDGGLAQSAHSSYMSMSVEAQGSLGVVLNGSTPLETVEEVCRIVDTPVISTVTPKYIEADKKSTAGISIINIGVGKEAVEAVHHFRKKYPELLIIVTDSSTEESIAETIQAGANAITYTSPSSGELFSCKMEEYREAKEKDHE